MQRGTMDPLRLFDVVSRWAVLVWMVAHTVSWALVEGCRLAQSTRLKIKRIFQQDVAEE